MCGRYESPSDLPALQAMLPDLIVGDEVLGEPWDIRPTNRAPIIALNHEGKPALIKAHWGLIPFWHKGTAKEWKATTFNAKLEEVSTKPTFRNAWAKKRRAIIPANLYYEWKGPKGSKVKYTVRRSDNLPLAMAGLWENAKLADGEYLSMTMLTRAPGPQMLELHDREPVILHPSDWQAWLAGSDDLNIGQPWPDGAFKVNEAI